MSNRNYHQQPQTSTPLRAAASNQDEPQANQPSAAASTVISNRGGNMNNDNSRQNINQAQPLTPLNQPNNNAGFIPQLIIIPIIGPNPNQQPQQPQQQQQLPQTSQAADSQQPQLNQQQSSLSMSNRQSQPPNLPESDVVLRDALNELFYLLNTKGITTNDKAIIRRLHSGVTCSFCLTKNIEGDRYLCTVCNEYNLCSDCFCSRLFNNDHQLAHPVLCIVNPIKSNVNSHDLTRRTRLDQLAIKYKDITHADNLKCDMCRKPLIGIRMKCDVCFNYDLCYTCWQKKQHDQKHPFIVYTEAVVKEINFNQIELGKLLGSGAFGSVYQAYVKPSRNLVACKMVENDKSKKKDDDNQVTFEKCLKSIQDEINAHYEIRSAYVCKLFAFAKENMKLCMILEYMDNGTLEDLIHKERDSTFKLPLIRKLKIMGDVASGLYDIHKKNFVHCDIKPDNILINSDYVAKISDLGIIKNKNLKSDDGLGNVFYLPNEFFSRNYTNLVDVYSFGLVMYHLFSGHRHEIGEFNMPILKYMSNIKLDFVRDLIQLATNQDPNKRMPIDFYRTMLRNYTSVSDHYFQLDEIAVKLSNQPTEVKDEVLVTLNKYFINVVRAKIKLKTGLVKRGLSTNELNSPEIDEMLTKIASKFKVNELTRQKQERKLDSKQSGSSCCTII